MTKSILSRRRFLHLSAWGAGATVLAACGATSEPAAAPTATLAPTATPVPPTAVPPTATPEPPAPAAAMEAEVEWVSNEVVDMVLDSDEWSGDYGRVQMKLHEGVHNGESVYYVRTDSGSPGHAEMEGLTFVPLLNAGAGMENRNIMYLFMDGRPSPMKYIPGDDNYGSLFECIPVNMTDDSLEFDSVEAVEAALEDGGLSLSDMGSFYVNYPLVKWAGGELSVDPDLEGVLPGGQLFEAPDTDGMIATFKLHQCYPGSRYILTDTAAAPMAPMMNIPAAPPTQQLKELGGTDEIWVFGNGIEGPGVMGFQPAIFDNKAGTPAWSPFWDHFTLTWNDGIDVRHMTTSDEVRAAIEAEDVTEWNGVPDSHPNGFVVNCPVPVRASNTFMA